MKNITAEALNRLLIHKDWSQSELANRLGMSQSYISRALKGHHSTNYDQLIIRMQEKLGVNPSYLKTGTGEMFLNEPEGLYYSGEKNEEWPDAQFAKLSRYRVELIDKLAFLENIYENKLHDLTILHAINAHAEELVSLEKNIKKYQSASG